MLRIATRGSELALWQSNVVAQLLRASGRCDEVELVVVKTQGDKDQTSALHSIGGKGVFVKEVQQALLDHQADIAVHSAKDLPAITPPGLTLAAVPQRADSRDVLVGACLNELPHRATVATGSIRRKAQLKALREDLQFVELRGNIATRISKLESNPDIDAIVMAGAAVERLELDIEQCEYMSITQMVPQVGQGALAVECRSNDTATTAILSAINDHSLFRRFSAERHFLELLGGDCSMPAAAYCEHAIDETTGEAHLKLTGFLAKEDLSASVQVVRAGHDPHKLAKSVLQTLTKRLEEKTGQDMSKPGGTKS